MSNLKILAKIKSAVKGHHVYCFDVAIGYEFQCELQPTNMYSNHAIIVKRSDNTVGHVPDALAQKSVPLLENSMVEYMEAVVTEMPRDALEGKWTLGGGIEIPCVYKLYGLKINKRRVRKKL